VEAIGLRGAGLMREGASVQRGHDSPKNYF